MKCCENANYWIVARSSVPCSGEDTSILNIRKLWNVSIHRVPIGGFTKAV